ncbi:MAG: T9SS type A sorting domain-containing protein [Chitinophagales bacterium]|nr:T9SS type A sorting domain-containing protein [Chitinophagales bacterium]
MKVLKFTLFLIVLFIGNFLKSQTAIGYYDFEDNNARNTTVETTIETAVSTIGTPAVSTYSLTDAHGAGNAANYGGSIDGMAIGYYGFTTGGRPAATAALTTPHIKFGPFNTQGLSTITLTMDVMGIGTKMPSHVNVYVSDDDVTYTRISANPALTGSFQTVSFSLGTIANNKSDVYIIVLGYGAGSNPDATDGVLRIDNFTLNAVTFTQSLTMTNASLHGTGLTSGTSNIAEYKGFTLNNALATLTASSDLSFNGRITLTNGIFNIGNNTLTFQNSTLSPFARTSGTLTVGASANIVFGSSTVASSTLPNALFTSNPANFASLTIDRGSGNTVSFSNNPIQLSGNLVVNSGIFSINNASGDVEVNGTVNVNNSGELRIAAANNFVANGDVNVNNSALFNITGASANAAINGNLNINNTSEVRTTGRVSGANTSILLAGNLHIAGTLNLYSTTGTVTVDGNITGSGSVTGTISTRNRIILTGGSNSISSSITYGNLEINSTGTISLNGSTTINGFLRLTLGEFVIGNNTLSLFYTATPIQRNGTSQTGTITTVAGSNIVIGDGTQTTNVTIPNETFTAPTTAGSLTIDRASAYVLWGNNPITLTGNLNINQGTGYFSVNNASGTIDVGGNLNINDGEFRVSTAVDVSVNGNVLINGNLGLINSSATLTINGNILGTGTQTNSTGVIVMVGSGTTIINNIEFDNLEINSNGNVSLVGNTSFVGFIRLTKGNFVIGNNSLTLLYNGALFQRDGVAQVGKIVTSSGTNILIGDGTQTATMTIANEIFTTPTTIYNLTINKSSGATNWGNNPITISGDFNLHAGTSYFSVNNASGTIDVGGDLNINSGEFRIYNVAVNVNVGGDLNMTNSTIYLRGANATVTISGDVTGSGTQTASTGRIIMVGSGTTLSSAIEYNNVEINSTGNVSLTGNTSFSGRITLTAGSLVVGSNTLTLHTYNSPLVRSSGTITLSSNSSLSFGTAGFTGGNAFTIPNNVFNGTEFKNFTINRTNQLTLNNQNFFLRGLLSIEAGTLRLPNNYLFTLRSTSLANTAQVGPIGATGNITYGTNAAFRLERYIPQTGGTGIRQYRDLAAGLHPGTGTIYDNWQEGGGNGLDNGVYYGTHISGKQGGYPGGVDATTGFDITQSGAGSLSTFDVNGSGASVWTTWSTATSKNTKTTLSPFKGYRVLIRGNRLVDLYQNPTPTGMNAPAIIRTKGKLITGDVAFTTTGVTANGVTDNSVKLNSASATGFTIIPNPYACLVDWSLVYADASNISSAYYLYDPNIVQLSGVYVTYNSVGDITVPAASAANKYIQPGQAIFVRNSTTSPSVTFKESHKAPTGDFTETFRSANSSSTSRIYINLNKKEGNSSVYTLRDGAAVAFRSDFNDGDGPEDAAKISNSLENISIISKSNKQWCIEGRQQAVADDTVTLRMYYGTGATVGGNYQIEINTEHFENNGLQAYLLDKYTNTLTQLTMGSSSTYNYTVTNNANTYNLRFAIVFKTNNALPVTFINVAATQTEKKVNVGWSVAESNISNYEIERGSNVNELSVVGNTLAVGTAISSEQKYNWLDVSPLSGNNYYRIKAIGKDGKITYSSTVLVRMSEKGSSITVYPNPIKDRKMNILSENLAKGNYEIQIYNLSGQLMYSSTINHNGGTASYSVSLPNSIISGMYQLAIKGKDYNNTQSIIVE